MTIAPSPAPQSVAAPGTSTAVEALGLGHSYGDRVALSDIDFSVEEGEIFGVLGPNGGGKSTLFRILSTLIPPARGTLRLFGRNALEERHAVRRELGVVFQSPSLDPFLSVGENLLHQGHLYGLSGSALLARTQEVLERFAIEDRRRERVSRLSGGLRRRVEIAKALLHHPRLLVLDEPSTGLDPAARRDMWTHLSGLARSSGVAVVFTTHLMDEAERAHRLAVLDRGRLVAVATPDTLKARVGGDVITVESDDPRTLAPELARRFAMDAAVIDGRIRMECPRGHEFVASLVESFPGRVKSVSVGMPTLEDAFIHLTGHRLGDDESNDPALGPGTGDLPGRGDPS